MSCDPPVRWAMPFWITGLTAALVKLFCGGIADPIRRNPGLLCCGIQRPFRPLAGPGYKKRATHLSRGCPPAQISIRHPSRPAVSFPGGFQTPAGPQKASAYPPGRQLKPITEAEIGGHS